MFFFFKNYLLTFYCLRERVIIIRLCFVLLFFALFHALSSLGWFILWTYKYHSVSVLSFLFTSFNSSFPYNMEDYRALFIFVFMPWWSLVPHLTVLIDILIKDTGLSLFRYPSYDHLEVLFTCIRARGGASTILIWNNSSGP